MKNFHKEFNINKLIDPKYFNEPLDIEESKKDLLLRNLEKMTFIRKVENKLALEKKNGSIKGPVHLGVGQEAIPVGISNNISEQDFVFGAHRSHTHILSLGTDLRKFFAEILGKATGHSKGMGGSMHLIDKSCGFYGSVPIVAGTIPIAVGAALSAKIKKTNQISISYFGDGACEEGVFHESLNLSKLLNLPILFVCENNLFSSHMYISQRQPLNSVARFAIANNIPYEIIDGNDICKVNEVAAKFTHDMRSIPGPCFIEAVTYRWYGHVDWRDDIDVGVNRSELDLLNWKKRDPIQRLIKGLEMKNFLNKRIYDNNCDLLDKKISECWELACRDPYPNLEESNKYLFK